MARKSGQDGLAVERERMLRVHLEGRGIRDTRVLCAMAEVPREAFVPEDYRSQAYSDGPLPIGDGQTISQPYIVALMTQQLQVGRECNVLELGTGSGYQTAVLARLAGKVYTIERLGGLSAGARAVLEKLGIENVEYFVGDGSCGWPDSVSGPEGGMFERIMITAAVPEVPGPVREQLAEAGRLVAPVGGPTVQRLMAYEKVRGRIRERFICDVRFVRLLGEFSFSQ